MRVDNSPGHSLIRRFFTIGCQLVALGFLIVFLQKLPYYLFLTFTFNTTLNWAEALVSLCLLLLNGLIPVPLLLYARPLSNHLIPDRNWQIENESIILRALVIGVLCLGGVWFFLKGFTELTVTFYDWSVGHTVTEVLIRSGFEALTGLFLLYGSRPLSDVILEERWRKDFPWSFSFRNPFLWAFLIVFLIFLVILWLQ